jgi:hypothetical protein
MGLVVKITLAVLLGLIILRVGLVFLRSFAQPAPAPPPPGQLRRVRITYRCTVCGTEVRMTMANEAIPDPPRHCQEDMELVAPIDE